MEQKMIRLKVIISALAGIGDTLAQDLEENKKILEHIKELENEAECIIDDLPNYVK